jgi:cytochrome c5
LRRDVLAEYLTVHEAEVVSIMMKLYDEEEVLRTYIAAEVREASAKAAAEAAAKAAAEATAKATAEAAAEVEAATAKAAAAEAAGRLEGARVLIKTCRDLGLAQDETAVRVADGFRYSPEEAQAIVEDCWSVQ